MERLKNGGGSENSRREGCVGSNRGFIGRRGNSGIFIGREIGAMHKVLKSIQETKIVREPRIDESMWFQGKSSDYV